MQSRKDATTRYCSKLCRATCGITCGMFANDETAEKKRTQTQRNDLLSFRHRHSGVYLSSIRCNFVVFALARSRGYGVHKAHATAVAACPETTHGAVAQRRKEEAQTDSFIVRIAHFHNSSTRTHADAEWKDALSMHRMHGSLCSNRPRHAPKCCRIKTNTVCRSSSGVPCTMHANDEAAYEQM